MNAMTGIAGEIDALRAGRPTVPLEYTRRRSGHKAVRFNGWQLIEAKGAGEAETIWYDLTMYRTDADTIIVELVARRSLADEQDLSRVEVFPNLQEAASWLEAYCVGNDVPIPPSLATDDGPVAAAVLKAIQLRQRIARIQDDYHGLLSDVFEALDITETPALRPGRSPHENDGTIKTAS
jgi:hypothetical protein